MPSFTLDYIQNYLNSKPNPDYSYLHVFEVVEGRFITVRGTYYISQASLFGEGFSQYFGPIIGTYPIPTNTYELEVIAEEIRLVTLFRGEHGVE